MDKAKRLLNDESIKKVTNLVDLFLTQYFSLFDIFIKSICKGSEIIFPKEIDSLGSLYYYLNKLSGEEREKAEKLFKPLILRKKEIQEFKNYRDYLIHHGNLSIERIYKKIDEEYALSSYYVHMVEKKNVREYKENPKSQLKINIFIRVNLKRQLESIKDIINNLRK